MQAAVPAPTKARDLAYIALMAALMAICSWITIPIGPVPFTMQTFAIFTAVLLLGGRRGTVAFVVYLLMGVVGLPVFSGFSAGPGVLLGSTGGYLVGFLLGDLAYWFLTARLGERLLVQIPALLLANVLCYAFGTIWFYYVYTSGGDSITLLGILSACVIPFIIPGLVKLALALIVCRRISPHIKR